MERCIEGLHVFPLELHLDDRGAFTELWRATRSRVGEDEMFYPEQMSCSISRAGVLRGMHGQAGCAKLVTCVSGSIVDAVVDVREDSPTYRKTTTIALSSRRQLAVYVPAGCLHGFYVVEDAVVVYLQDREYDESAQLQGHWSDYGIDWPHMPGAPTVSAKDDGV